MYASYACAASPKALAAAALQTLDYGFPQMADPAVLKQYIFQKGLMTQSARQRREDKAAQSTLQVVLYSAVNTLASCQLPTQQCRLLAHLAAEAPSARVACTPKDCPE